jgi:cytochrome oxidase Cu insertion factor (SCO1/SenC/PrrC family)
MSFRTGSPAVLLALALTLAGCLEGDEADEPFWGVELPGEAASDFTLVDQHGDNFSLVDTTGKVVVMRSLRSTYWQGHWRPSRRTLMAKT